MRPGMKRERKRWEATRYEIGRRPGMRERGSNLHGVCGSEWKTETKYRTH